MQGYDRSDRSVNVRVTTLTDSAGVVGKDVTPFLLDYFHRETRGASLAANVALVLSNARLAAEIAAAVDGAERSDAEEWRR